MKMLFVLLLILVSLRSFSQKHSEQGILQYWETKISRTQTWNIPKQKNESDTIRNIVTVAATATYNEFGRIIQIHYGNNQDWNLKMPYKFFPLKK